MGQRFLTVTGRSPGAGKTTLVRDIAAELSERGEPILLVDEDAVWGERRLDDEPVDYRTAWPEFRALLHERQSVPTAEDLMSAFGSIEERVPTEGVWLQDWSWIDLAATLPWSESASALLAFAVALRERAARLQLIWLHLTVDPNVGLQRVVAERGRVWLARHIGIEACSDVDALRILAARSEAWESRVSPVLASAGWVRQEIDGEGSRSDVRTRALEALDNDAWLSTG
jgi:hypothetical protein